MPEIKLNLIEGFVKKFKSRDVKFEVEPLDVNLAKLQFNLTKRVEREVYEHGDFAPLVEKFESKDPTLDISTIKVVIRKSDNDSPKKKLRVIELHVNDKAGLNDYVYTLKEGEKKDIVEAVNKRAFFFTCKSVAMSVSEGVK